MSLLDYGKLGFAIVLLWAAIACCSEIDSSYCLDHGFSSRLTCNHCDELHQFKLNDLSDSCKQCCHSESDAETVNKQVYPYARLIICECKFGRYPQIEAFIKSSRPKKFPGLEIRYAAGANPVIKLLNENREVQETLGIEKWTTDTLEEFLMERLKH